MTCNGPRLPLPSVRVDAYPLFFFSRRLCRRWHHLARSLVWGPFTYDVRTEGVMGVNLILTRGRKVAWIMFWQGGPKSLKFMQTSHVHARLLLEAQCGGGGGQGARLVRR